MPNLPVVAQSKKMKSGTAKMLTTKLGTAVKQEVAKQISKKAENKLIYQVGNTNQPISSTYPVEWVGPGVTQTTVPLRPLLPAMVSGTEGNQRLGLNVSPKVLKIRGTIGFNYDAISSEDYSVRLMVVTNRSQKSMPPLVADAAGVYSSTLMWDGQKAEGTPYLGCAPYYNTLPINNKSWNVLDDRIIHLRKGLGEVIGTNNESQGEVFMSSTRSATFEIVLTQKELPATLKYESDTSPYPTNYAPVLCIGWVDNTNAISPGDTLHNKEVYVQWTSYMIYEDN